MSEEAVATKTDPAPVTDVTKTKEYQDALAAEREQIRLGYDAEYRRKHKELEERLTPPRTNANGADWFAGWSERHGLPADAGKELAQAAVGYVETEVLPNVLRPVHQAHKHSELRAQRSELRALKPKLGTLDDKYHAEVMKLLDPLDPKLIGPDSYARALHMVIGEHIEELNSERGEDAGAGKNREVAPGPEPLPNAAPGKAKAVALNAKQKQFAEERGMSDADLAEMMVERARKMEGQGRSKAAIRAQLGEMLGNLEF